MKLTVKNFLKNYTIKCSGTYSHRKDVYKAYKAWVKSCDENIWVMPVKDFREELEALGFKCEYKKINGIYTPERVYGFILIEVKNEYV